MIEASFLDSIQLSGAERMRINARCWTEDKHFCTAADFRRDVAELVGCLHEALPWDDLERVIKAWGIAKWRCWVAVV